MPKGLQIRGLEHIDSGLEITEYRVIFDVEGDEIVALRVGHRKDIYRKK